MVAIIRNLIEAIFWLAIFLSPVLFFGATALWIYASDVNYFELSIFILIIGVASGITWAEWARRNHGCARFIGNILATPDIWPPKPDKE